MEFYVHVHIYINITYLYNVCVRIYICMYIYSEKCLRTHKENIPSVWRTETVNVAAAAYMYIGIYKHDCTRRETF